MSQAAVKALLLFLLLSLSPALQAHEVRPASLDITQTSEGLFEFRFRQPINGEYMISIHPTLSSGWLDADPQQRILTDAALIQIWTVDPADTVLAGQVLSIRGLERTITDVLVSISYANGLTQTHLISAASARMTLPAATQSSALAPQYLWLGLGHIWSGPDHLLYILGLMLLIANPRALVLAISSFTLAHSITLACAALNLVQLRAGAVEAVISLSIVYVAVEIVHAQRGSGGMASRKPWLIAFLFGLLHGFGFASALQEIGLPQQALGYALLLFNAGIEIGQLLFIGLMLALWYLCKQLIPQAQKLHLLNDKNKNSGRSILTYGIGSLASFWLIERLVTLL